MVVCVSVCGGGWQNGKGWLFGVRELNKFWLNILSYSNEKNIKNEIRERRGEKVTHSHCTYMHPNCIISMLKFGTWRIWYFI